MPTRTELNSVHKRLHDLRRELRSSQEAQRDPAPDGRDAEIAAMRAEIDDLRRLVSNSSSAPVSRVAMTPKATTRRKRAPPRRKRAAKRTHVASKSTPIVKPVPVAIRPVVVRVQRAATAPKAARRVARRAGRRAKPSRSVRSASKNPSASKNAVTLKPAPKAASFGDAIAAIRMQLAQNKSGKKKAKAARLSLPSRTSVLNARSGRSRS
jgi:hypothetical protein